MPKNLLARTAELANIYALPVPEGHARAQCRFGCGLEKLEKLEKLEETARLWLMAKPEPLPESAIAELREVFGAQW